jgi:hypothetical protein
MRLSMRNKTAPFGIPASVRFSHPWHDVEVRVDA